MADAKNLQKEIFSKYYLKDIVKGKEIITTIKNSENIQDVLQKMDKNKITSCPVIDSRTGRYLTITSVSEIVVGVLLGPLLSAFDGKKEDDKFTEKDLAAVLQKADLDRPIGTVLGLTSESKYLQVFLETTKMPTVLSSFSNGVHRALVLRNAEKGPGIGSGPPCYFSQTDCAIFIRERIKEERAKFGQASLVAAISHVPIHIMGKIKQMNESLVSVREDETALVGFLKLLRFKVRSDWSLGALPVLSKDGKGKIVGTLSASDLRGLTQDEIHILLLPVSDYLKYQYGKVRTPVSITLETTFGDALDKILDNHVHRVWIVDENEKAVGVWSLTDAIYQFTTEAAK